MDVIRGYDRADDSSSTGPDPPYLHQTRGDSHAYGFEMDETEHRELRFRLSACAWQGCRLRLPPAPFMDLLFQGCSAGSTPPENIATE